TLYQRSMAIIRLREPVATQHSFRDGRTIEVVYRPMADGGWVATYEDISERSRAARRLKAQSDLFEAALANMSHGLLMLDGDLRITAVNGRFLAMYGLSPERVHVGASARALVAHSVEVGNYHGHAAEDVWPEVQARLSLAEPFQREDMLADGRAIAISYTPLPGGGWVTIHEDVTERRRARDEIERQNLRFTVAMANMVQGLCVFDGDMRLVVCNRRYADMFGLPPALIRPGTALLDILAHRVAHDHYSGDPEAYIDERLAVARGGKPMNVDLDLRDGRALAMSHRPLPDGGWVSTFEDITERKRFELALAEQNRRFDAALSNMSQGLCMLDADLCLTVCNARYVEMLALSPDLARPGTPLRAIVAHGVANGRHGGLTVDEVMAPRLDLFGRGDPAVLETAFADGRIIETAYRPMPGGGWVATYEDVTERRKAEARIAHMARHDALTELPNRLLLRERMEEALRIQAREGQAFAVLCLDLDQFKAVNDTLGHPVGDALLRQVADRLRAITRAGDTIARLGGDEFAIIQPVAHPHEAEALARRIVEAVGLPYAVEGNHVVVGTSIGIALAPGDGADPDTLFKNADLALYRAKPEGRGVARFFEPEMDAQIKRRRRLELDLRAAHDGQQFELWYQPQVDAATGVVGGFEALLRWRHGERGLVSPADFIPLAEEIGLIVPLGEWVIRRACADAALWPVDVRVAVNVSAAQFGSRSIEKVVLTALAATGLDPRRLELEITESVLLTDTEATLATLHRLRGIGVRISLDDFGTGYSSLSYLRRFPFDKIKIDRSFVRELERADSAAIVEAVVDLAAKLGMATTAEGVETAEQLALVRAKGCTEVQGYLFSPPRPGCEVPAILRALSAPMPAVA
ncbi:MAG TPA: PAS-domain containing protein, partial [Salinarimonas sp.]|nr:PAS-domain containing protein [Salinarimonas sp.]